MKKVCLILPSLKAGGMERTMVVLSNYLSNIKGIEVHLILLGENTKFFPVPLLVKIYEPNFKLQKGKCIYAIKVLFYLRKLLKKIKPYSLLSFGETYNSFVLLASLGLPIKKYISDRSKPHKDWGAFHNNLRKLLYRLADGIISQTSASKDFIQTQVS